MPVLLFKVAAIAGVMFLALRGKGKPTPGSSNDPVREVPLKDSLWDGTIPDPDFPGESTNRLLAFSHEANGMLGWYTPDGNFVAITKAKDEGGGWRVLSLTPTATFPQFEP